MIRDRVVHFHPLEWEITMKESLLIILTLMILPRTCESKENATSKEDAKAGVVTAHSRGLLGGSGGVSFPLCPVSPGGPRKRLVPRPCQYGYRQPGVVPDSCLGVSRETALQKLCGRTSMLSYVCVPELADRWVDHRGLAGFMPARANGNSNCGSDRGKVVCES